jgi:hypothetical protein
MVAAYLEFSVTQPSAVSSTREAYMRFIHLERFSAVDFLHDRAHLHRVMKSPLRYYFSSSGAHAKRSTAREPQPPVAGDFPAPGEVLLEIGLVLAIHLAVGLAIVLTLRTFAIA